MIPRIQIRQQFAKLGIDADIGRQELRQPPATLTMRTTPRKVTIIYRSPDLVIDQSRAWDALGLGGILEAMTRIRAQAKRVALDGIARIAEKGDRLAAIHLPTNAIADIAQEEAHRFYEFDYFGPASMDNVDIRFTTYKPEIHFSGGDVNIDVRVNRPVHNYYRGKLDIYMQQYAKVEIIPPQIDALI